ncbi:hypothetical protein [Actinophytocola sediminis]
MQQSPAPPTARHRARRIWTAVAGLAFLVGGLGVLLAIEAPPAAAQALPPTATYTVTCGADDTITYVAELTNPNPTGTPVGNFYVRLEWSDGRSPSSGLVRLGPNETKSYTLTNGVGVDEPWTNTMAVRTGPGTTLTPVVGPIERSNPCLDEPPTTTTTTTTTMTTTTTTTTTTTAPPPDSSTPPSSDPPSSTPSMTESTDPATDPPSVLPTTPVPTDGVVNTANNAGGGLAATGVAVAAIVGLGAVLFANGTGLLRLVRRDRTDDDD